LGAVAALLPGVSPSPLFANAHLNNALWHFAFNRLGLTHSPGRPFNRDLHTHAAPSRRSAILDLEELSLRARAGQALPDRPAF
jgi:hypothetical protein